MATQPPERPIRPPDLAQIMREEESNKSQQESQQNSSHSSSNLHLNEVMNIASSGKKMEGIRENIFPDDNGVTKVNVEGEADSYRDEPATIQFPKNSTVPIQESQSATRLRITPESPNKRLQIQSSSENIRDDSMIGEYSPQLGEHLTTISTSLDGQIAGEQITANVAGGQVTTGKRANKNFYVSDEKELTRSGINQPRMQRNGRANHNQNDYSNSSWFSFGIDPMILEQNPIPSHQENSQVQIQQKKIQRNEGNQQCNQSNTSNEMVDNQQTTAKGHSGMISNTTNHVNPNAMDKGKAQMHENANEQHTSIHREQTQVQTNVQNSRNNNQYTHGINQVWQAKDKQQPLQQAQNKTNANQNQLGNKFPKVSSNFEQQNPNQRGRADTNPSLVKEK
ncbi:hypothetical protein KY285_013206 [Solanum tuberosum]|nr:hypothetical protein KY285_013206 [Solanum tuberosum]